jgi:hypothetical protein
MRERGVEYLAHTFKSPDSRKLDCTKNGANCPPFVRGNFDTKKAGKIPARIG